MDDAAHACSAVATLTTDGAVDDPSTNRRPGWSAASWNGPAKVNEPDWEKVSCASYTAEVRPVRARSSMAWNAASVLAGAWGRSVMTCALWTEAAE